MSSFLLFPGISTVRELLNNLAVAMYTLYIYHYCIVPKAEALQGKYNPQHSLRSCDVIMVVEYDLVSSMHVITHSKTKLFFAKGILFPLV